MMQANAKRYRLGLLILVVLASIWLIKHRHQLSTDKKVDVQTITVTGLVAEETSVARTMTFSGPVVGRDEVPVYSDLDQGHIDKVVADAGQRVKVGAILATVDSGHLKIQKAQQQANKERAAAGVKQQETALEEAKAQYEQAKSERQRGETTAQTGLISKEVLEQKVTAEQLAKTRMQAAKSALSMAQAELKVAAAQLTESDLRLNQAAIRSPVSGLVVERNAKTGMLLTQNNEPLFMILRDDDLEIELEVSADDAPRLKLGMPVIIQLTGGASSNTGSVSGTNSNQLNAVKTSIGSWVQAWQDKNIEAYLASYSDKFVPEQKMERAIWLDQRKKRLATKGQLQINLAQLNVRIAGDKATAEFVQHYSANSKKEDTNKRLSLVHEGASWLIVREQVLDHLDVMQAEHAPADSEVAKAQVNSGYNGKVSRAATQINRQNQIAKVRVRFNQAPNLILGQFARVIVNSVSSRGVYLPDTAVRFDGSSAYVFTVQQGIAKRIPVKVGQHIADKLEVLEGVPAGMLVIDSAASFLRDGEPVQVAQGKAK